jgi:putative endonuclease
MWNVYILECSDGSFYTGITTDLKRRVEQHNNKKGAKSVMGKLPVKLVYHEIAENNVSAAKREREIKSWTREKKKELINNVVYSEK